MNPRRSSTVFNKAAAFQAFIPHPFTTNSFFSSRCSVRFTRTHHVRSVSTATVTDGIRAISEDERWMRVALHEARRAFSRNEVPVGAVIVRDNVLISSCGNTVELMRDPTCHAEMNAIRAACKSTQAWRLINTTLYCTLEPCAMCLSGAALARISRVVYGAQDLRLGACGTWINLPQEKHPYHSFGQVVGGVLQEECSQILKDFFRQRRIETKRGD